MPEKCSHCGALAVEWEGYDGQADGGSQRVCRQCGLVTEEGSFTNDCTFDQPQLASSNEFRHFARSLPSTFVTRNTSHKVPKGKKHGLQRVRQYADVLHCSSAITQQASELFEQVYMIQQIKTQLNETKAVVAGCCLYIICRNTSWPVTVTDMSEITSCEPCKFVSWTKKVVEAMNIELKHLDIMDMISSVCAALSEEVRNTTQEIVKVCREVYLSEGRRPHSVIIASAYHAWRGLDFLKRGRVKLVGFIKQYNLHTNAGYHVATVRQRSKEIANLLCKLAKELPWVSDSTNETTFHEHICDVLKYQKSLMASALAKLKSEVPPPVEDSDDSEDCDEAEDCVINEDCPNAEVTASFNADNGKDGQNTEHASTAHITNVISDLDQPSLTSVSEKPTVNPMSLWKDSSLAKKRAHEDKIKEKNSMISAMLDRLQGAHAEQRDLDREEVDSDDLSCGEEDLYLQLPKKSKKGQTNTL